MSFFKLCFEYCLECSERDIAAEVVFFGTLYVGIEANMTKTRLHSSLDEELDLDSFLFLLGVISTVPMGNLFSLFNLAIVSYL